MSFRSRSFFLLIVLITISLRLSFNADFSEIPKSLMVNRRLDKHTKCVKISNPMLPGDVIIHRLNARGIKANNTGWDNFKILDYNPNDFNVYNLQNIGFTWPENLVWVYSHFFLWALEFKSENDFFVILEDDVGLDNEALFLKELQCVLSSGVNFFSFFNENNQKDDMYDYGTQLFFIKKDFARQWLSLRLKSIRGKPIDIHISSLYPFQKTINSFITHLGNHLE